MSSLGKGTAVVAGGNGKTVLSGGGNGATHLAMR
jgi:hypothetical protein